ncbi:hypothetical protein [Micromonospora sp. NBC_01638]|uniref:hypothetical protein n=1 Tax=Micromonospora sp. NBC_01638 TaxID=2975982 RepID=UPI00386AEE80|nr:hypothetical protein OG811_28345 [Micromonospora sp. NBC_01638]
MTLKGALAWIVTGGVGLFIGATVGLFMTVAFEDPLKKLLLRVRRKGRRLRTGRRAPEASDFTFGGLTSPCMIVAGNGTEAIKEELVHLIVNDEPVELPAELTTWRSEIATEQQARKDSGKPHHWNGDCFAVDDLVEERTARDEDTELFLHLRRTDYYSFLASQHLDRRFRDGTTPRTRYIDPVGHRRAPVFMSLSLGTSTLVITTDNRVLICQRGSWVGSRPLHWGVSADEGLSPRFDSPSGLPPRLHAAARRGLGEELALEDHEYRLALLGITIDTERHQWDSVFVAYAHDLTSEQLEGRMKRGTKDGSLEIASWEFVPFDVTSVLQRLHAGRPERKWTPVAPAALYLALVHEYGRWRVERLVRSHSKRFHR